MKLKNKIILLFVIVVLLSNLCVGLYTINNTYGKVIEASQEKLKSDLALGKTFLNERYPGNWRIKDGNLYKGNTLMNNRYDIVDEIGNLTGDTVTIFQGNTRVATNVKMQDGTRAIGTHVSQTVANTVLVEGLPYIGKANVVGVWNQTAYEPITNVNGKIIGIWYVGVPNTVYKQIASDFSVRLILFTFLILVCASFVIWLVVDTISRPLSALEKAANEIASGNLNNNIEILSKDEIGKLAHSFNIMVDKIREFAYHDYLTGLFNRRAMVARLKQETERCYNHQQNYCIVLGDIDCFKKVNDEHGHDVGDIVLKNISQIFKKNLSLENMTARWGGEEFLILLSDFSKDDGVLKAEILRKAIEDTSVTIGNLSVSVTMSFGVSDFSECSSFDECIRKADCLLYKSKESGRNKVTADF